MSSVFNQFNSIVNEIEPLWKIYLSDDDTISLSRNKINKRTLRIQLYGAYNAGKSTFINTLMGENAAKVGEIPTTDQVEEFNWNGYKLLDSPGVNAPIEHEKITLDSLKTNDLVVFIIRQDDQDVKDVYDRIFDCVEANKYIFIILNYNGLDPNGVGEGSVELLVTQINMILLREAEKRCLESKLNEHVKVLSINLNSALKGRLENKTKLTEASGYNSFLISFCEWIKSYDTEQKFVEFIKNFLQRELITPLLDILYKEISTDSDQQKLARAIHELEVNKKTLIINATSKLREIESSNKRSFYSNFYDSKDEVELRHSIEKYVNNTEFEFNNWFIQQGEYIKELIHNEQIIVDGEFFSENKSNYVFETLSSISSGYLKNENLVKDSLVGGLKTLRSNQIAFKGIWEKTFEKWAGKLVPIITIATTLFDAYRAGKREDEFNQQQKCQKMKLQQLIESISNDLVHNLVNQIEQNVNMIFEGQIQQYKNKLNQLNENVNVLEKNYSKIQLIASRLEQICLY